MATLLYDTGRNGFLAADATGGQIDWLNSTISVMLIHTSAGGTPYVFSAAHKYYSDVSAFANAIVAGAIGTPVNLGTKTAVAGVADAADATFTSVPAGANNQVDAIIIYKNNGGVAGTSLLIAYIDSTGASGLPVTPNGSNITLVWDNTANRIFKL
jgi:hypothetical protein